MSLTVVKIVLFSPILADWPVLTFSSSGVKISATTQVDSIEFDFRYLPLDKYDLDYPLMRSRSHSAAISPLKMQISGVESDVIALSSTSTGIASDRLHQSEGNLSLWQLNLPNMSRFDRLDRVFIGDCRNVCGRWRPTLYLCTLAFQIA